VRGNLKNCIIVMSRMRWASTNGGDEKFVWDTGEKENEREHCV
jgi:hypothetical protein